LERWKAERSEAFAGMLGGLARVQKAFQLRRAELWRSAAVEFGVPADDLPPPRQ
jgi:hypothetical protein